MFTNQGTVIHFNNPKVQASLAANTFTITGHAENKQLTEMLPGILNQLGADSLTSLRRLAETLPKPGSQKTPQWAVSISAIVLFFETLLWFFFHFSQQETTKPPWLPLKRRMMRFQVSTQRFFFPFISQTNHCLSWSMKPMKFLLGTFIKDFFSNSCFCFLYFNILIFFLCRSGWKLRWGFKERSKLTCSVWDFKASLDSLYFDTAVFYNLSTSVIALWQRP